MMRLELRHCDTCDTGTPHRLLEQPQIEQLGLGIERPVLGPAWSEGFAVCLACRTLRFHASRPVELSPAEIEWLIGQARK